MRIVKEEKIYISQNEADTWTKFNEILDGLERGSENPNIVKLVNKIQDYLSDLWEIMEDIE